MITPSLEAQLKEALSHQISLNTITRELANDGWSPDIIGDVQVWYQKHTPSPSPVTSPLSASDNSPAVRPHPNLLLTSIILIILLLFSSMAYAAYLIAYDKINFNHPVITGIVDKAVFSLPFLPKTAKYILYSAYLANKDAVRGDVDFSLISSSPDFKSFVGSDNVIGDISGYYNITDPANPLFDFSFNMGNDLNFYVRKGNTKNIYIKINHIPATLTTALHSDAATINPVLDNWIIIDSAAPSTMSNHLSPPRPTPKKTSPTCKN